MVAVLIVITVLSWLHLVSFATNMNADMASMASESPAAMSAMSGMATMPGMSATSVRSDMPGTSEMSAMAEMPGMNEMSTPVRVADTVETSSVSAMAGMMTLRAWTAADTGLMLTMWVVMMVGMMTPSATPTILLYARVYRRRLDPGSPYVPTGAFFLGYIAVWAAFSIAATGLQWSFERAALLSPQMVSASGLLSGLLLIAAGVYQWLPAKRACLRHCRTPVDFLSRRWKHGTSGAFRMGVEHSLYCLGCCWLLMLLLFVGGVMNLLWIAAMGILVLLEKVVPFGRWIGLIGGAGMIAAGVILIVPS